MTEIQNTLTVKIEKLLYEGFALARANDFPIFIENACVDDEVEIEITKKNKRYATGKIIKFIKESNKRVKPFCALHNVCGGCQWQYIEYNEQLKQKENIVRETIEKITGKNIKILPIIASPKQIEYRHKVQYPVSQTKVSKRIMAGYYKKNSHELVNIKFCPIQPLDINDIIEKIKLKAQELNITAYNEKKHSGTLRHIVIKNSDFYKQNLIIFVINSETIPDSIKQLANHIFKTQNNIKGICVNLNTKKGNAILSDRTVCIEGDGYYLEKIKNTSYKISSNSFFQVNPHSAEKMLEIVKSIASTINNKPTVLDAYSGVASFGIYLKDIAEEITCVEEIKSAHKDAIENIKINNANNVKAINGNAAQIFENFIKEKKQFDIVILDPPRKGCDKKAIDLVTNLAKDSIIYVSCNPATLARDLNYLQQQGFETEYIQPLDMFPHTYHIESIALIKRVKE